MRLPTGEQAFAVIHGVTSGNAVNLGTRTAPAERANVREIRGLTAPLLVLAERSGL